MTNRENQENATSFSLGNPLNIEFNSIIKCRSTALWKPANYLFYLLFFLFAFSNKTTAQVVGLTKTVSVPTALSGEEFIYTLDFGCSSLDADCVGAIIRDTLPAIVSYVSGVPVIVPTSGGPVSVAPVYDAGSHSIVYDFTTLPEGGLPDGFSGSVDYIVVTASGRTPNGANVTNKAGIYSSNAGEEIDSATTTISATPNWTLNKTVISGPIYYDQEITYKIEVCSDGILGNLDLHTVQINDTLPAGADFISATNGATWDSNDPGVVTWSIDSLEVTDPCTSFDITVVYPSADLVNNNTGLSTSIPKLNKAFLTSDVMGIPYNLMDSTNQALLPPVFMPVVQKSAFDNGILPIGALNYFTISVGNEGTAALDSFIVLDEIPDQFDLKTIRFESFSSDTFPVIIKVELNDNDTLIDWFSTNTLDKSFDTDTIPGINLLVDYVSAIQFDFGTVSTSFSGNIRLVVTPAYTGPEGAAVDNADNSIYIDSTYENCVSLTSIRPLDGAKLGPDLSCDEMCIKDTIARLDPAKMQRVNYIDMPDGSVTTGNPYFQNSRVTYTVRLENDGVDGTEPDNMGAMSFATVIDPIGSDLLPADVTYVANSWKFSDNGTSLTLDTLGGNPLFEKIDNFNGTGRTLLRWIFNGNFSPEEYVDIEFDVIINEVAEGTILTNEFCMSAAQDFFCDEEVCGTTDTLTADLRNFYGAVSKPDSLIGNIIEMCCKSVSITVSDSTAMPEPSKDLLTSGPFAPTGTDKAELDLANDTIAYRIAIANDPDANIELPNPIISDLLPIQLAYVPGSMQLDADNTGLGFTDDGTNPTFEVIEDFAGTGRTLLRWSFTGDLPINTEVSFFIKTLIKTGTAGTMVNQLLAGTNDENYDCNSGVIDEFDLDGDGDVLESLCGTNASGATILSLASLSAKKYVKGALDTAFLQLPDVAMTLPGDSVVWRMLYNNPGNIPLTEAVVVDIFPYIGDVGVQLNTTARETEWRPFLTMPITVPANITLYYSQEKNPCRPEIEPIDPSGCIDDWSTSPPADLSTIQAIKLEFQDTIQPNDSIIIDIKMMAPDSGAVTGQIAWNSIGRNAKELPAQEPNKVGVALKYYDMALRKTLASGQANPVETKDTVTFKIEVFNQGTYKTDSITIHDYIPDGLTLADTDWTSLNDSTASITLAGFIQPNESKIVEITFAIDITTEGQTIINGAEIVSFMDSLGMIAPDYDSPNDTIRGNDPFVNDNIEGDNPADEDDHDRAEIMIKSCVLTAINYTTECLDNGTPLDPLDDRFILRLTPTGTSLGTSYSITAGYLVNSITYDSTFTSEGDSTFMAVMGGLNLTIQDDTDVTCQITDTIPPPPPCSVIDLALEKSIDTICAESGNNVVYTLLVKKESWDILMTGIQVRDTLPNGLSYISHLASQGTFSNSTGLWNIGDIAEGVDSLTLTITAKVDDYHDGGIMTNKAEISASDLNDIDSTPNNSTKGEDDIDFACLSVPIYLCPDLQDSIMLITPIGSQNVQWMRDTGTGNFIVGTDSIFWAKNKGTYTFTADVNLCDGGKCCPYYIREGCFDLALKKTLATGQATPVAPGDNVTFTITVYNQGNFVAHDVDLVDYIPANMSLNDIDWTNVDDSTATYTIPTSIAVNDSAKADIILKVDLNYQDSLLINFAEIMDATDKPSGSTKKDRDSDPDDTRTDDAGGVPESATDNEINQQAPIDEDDHDPAAIIVHQIYDLALKKTLAPSQSSYIGWRDTVDFQITIYNQGTLHAYDILIADYIPDSLILMDMDWALVGDTATFAIDSIAGRDSVKIEITLAVDTAFRGSTIINYSEINYSTEYNGSGIAATDEDSFADQNSTNDSGGQPESAADDFVDGVGGGTIGDGIAATDEDDHDPAQITVNQCVINENIISVLCDNNSTGDTLDDYFIVNLTGVSDFPGHSNKFEVLYSGTVLNPGGTTYGQTVTIGEDQAFDADGVATYLITIRDLERIGCSKEITIGPLDNCLVCPPKVCLPISIEIKKKE